MSLPADLSPTKKEGIKKYLEDNGLDESIFQVFVDCFFRRSSQIGIEDIAKSLRDFLGEHMHAEHSQAILFKKRSEKAKETLKLKDISCQPGGLLLHHSSEGACDGKCGSWLYFMATQDWDLSDTDSSHKEDGCVSMPTISWDGSEMVLRPKFLGQLEKEQGNKGSTST